MHRNPSLLFRAAASLLRPATGTPPPLPAPPQRRLLLFPAHHHHQRARAFSAAAAAGDYGKDVDEVNRKFAEAREEIEAAMDSKETVYFDEEAACARDAAGEALSAYESLLERLPPAEADSLRRSMGLKMEQLKAELNQLDE
uniref:Uncharacterized protein n=1 Tax=Leersia perrieri TaxID=77586 RepID=A0A0D9WDH4_9ORYZ